MSEMIERVARALMKVNAKRPADAAGIALPVLSSDPDFDDLPRDATEGTSDDEITQEAVFDLARAAIEAMREPTPAMFDAAASVDRYAEPGEEWGPMIDAALGKRS